MCTCLCGFFLISDLLYIETSNIDTGDRYHKIFEIREGSWLYIARNVHMHDKHSKENVLSSKPQENERNSREKKIEATGVDSCGLSNHSFGSGGATAACKSECSKFMADRSLTRLRMDMFVVKPALCADKYLRNS